MSVLEKLTAELKAEKHKSALYEKNLRLAVESCKVLKSEKDNLSNIIAGFACSEVNGGGSLNDLKRNITSLMKEFQTKETALVQARTAVMKENAELKRRLSAIDDSSSSSSLSGDKTDQKFIIAELEQKLRKEISLNRKYEKKLQQLEQSAQQNATDNTMEKLNKKLEEEKEQFKKLYEDSHGRSIFLERKFASLQLDQAKDEAETTKTITPPTKIEDDFRISNLENQIMIMTRKCDERENEVADLSTALTSAKGEINRLNEMIDHSERNKSPLSDIENFTDRMTEEYAIFKQENPSYINLLDFCCSSLRDDIEELIEVAKSEKKPEETQLARSRSDIHKHEKTIEILNKTVAEHEGSINELEQKLRKTEKVLASKDSAINIEKEELRKAKESLRAEHSRSNELEQEVHKQRTRAMDEIDNRDKEIEALKKMLVNFRHEKLDKTIARKVSRHDRSSVHDDDHGSFRRSRTFSQDDSHVPTDPDSRNVYYENQLTKKELDIQDLRKQLMDVEVRLRENEALSMSRQLDSISRADEMSEKVRVLEGKLQMLSSTNEIDYLRNIFSQFLQTMSSPSPQGKLILKAMGSVLKVPISEMRLIDRK